MEIEQLFIDTVFVSKTEVDLPKPTMFYERDLHQKVASLAFVAIGVLGFAMKHYVKSLAMLASGISLLVWNFKSDYQDVESRKEFRQELENGKIKIEEYVAKHGWENIKRFGFQIHPLNGSLLDKEELKIMLLERLSSNFSSLLHKRNHRLEFQKGFLWQCIDEEVFTTDEIQRIRVLFQHNVQNFSLVDLLENYLEIKQLGFFNGFTNEKIVDYLEEHWMKFAKVEEQFIHWRERIMFAFQKEKNSLIYPPPIILHQSGKPPIVMPNTRKLSVYYEKLSQMKQKYLKEYQRLKDFRDEALNELQARFDALLER